jgi:kynureninase
VTHEEARQLDASDPLASARERFVLPEGTIYLDGNSLGALPKATSPHLFDVVERQWGEDLIASWNTHCWIDGPMRVAAKLAPIVGAKSDELLVADSTSVCLFKLLASAVRARPGRRTILVQEGNFPTDTYVAEGLAGMLGLQLRRADPAKVAAAIDADTAVVSLSHRHGGGERGRPLRRSAGHLGFVPQCRSDRGRPQWQRLRARGRLRL